MSPSSDRVKLEIAGATPFTELTVRDAARRPVTLPSNAGRTQVEVTPGLYTVTFREGDFVVQSDVIARAGTMQIKQPHPAPLESSIPIRGTPTTHEWHEGPAWKASQHMTHARGGDGVLMVFLRDVGVPTIDPDTGEARYPDAHVWQTGPLGAGASVLCPDGDELRFGSDPHAVHDHWAALSSQVPAGTSLLVLRDADRCAVFPLFVAHGWRTEVFVRCEASADRRVPSLATATVTMAHESQAFEPDRSSLRLAEQARQALSGGRTMHGRQLDELLRDKFDNPMLGIYGAQLLLALPEPPRDVLDVVLGNLQGMLGDGPDLRALRLQRERLDGGTPPEGRYRFSEPPMLAAAWRAVLALSTEQDDAVPDDSPCAAIATGATSAGPWMVGAFDADWTPPARIEAGGGLGHETLGIRSVRPQSDQQLAEISSRLNATSLPALEPELLEVALTLRPDLDEARVSRAQHLRLSPRATRTWTAGQLARHLRIPASVVRRRITRLLEHLSQEP